jgi:predicted transcriptional regulator
VSKRLQVTVKDEVYELVEKLSEELSVSKSAIITLAVQEYERNQEKKNA